MPPGVTNTEGVQELISEYHAVLPPELLMNETDMLLAALLMELKAQRLSDGVSESADVLIEQQRADYSDGSDHARGTYHSEQVTVDANEWTEIDLDFIAGEVDLRGITDVIEVAFADPTGENAVIEYDSNDSPVAGIPVQTSRVWLRGKSTSTTLTMEAWL